MPPLYKVKLGNQEFYFEKDAQLEDLLARERIPQVRSPTASATEVKLTEARWSASPRRSPQFEGYFARLRADFGIPAAELMIQHRLVEHEIEDADGGRPRDRRDRAERLRTRVDRAATRRVPRPARRDGDGHARKISVPLELARLADLQPLRKAYAKLGEIVGLPPFTVTVGKEAEVVETFEGCRARVLDAAKQGIQLSRYKGLGEMNAEQLWETTMDPAKRLLIRVDVEDARRPTACSRR